MKQAGFSVILLLVGVCVVLAAGLGGYYLISQKAKPVTPSTPQPFVVVQSTPVVVPTPMPDEAEELFTRIRNVGSDIQWSTSEATTEAMPTYGALSGKKITGLFTLNDLENITARVVDFDSMAQKNGWVEDIYQAADGVDGSVSGFKKNDGDKIRIFNIHTSFLDAARFLDAGKTLKEEKCPCHYKVGVFVSDPFSIPSIR